EPRGPRVRSDHPRSQPYRGTERLARRAPRLTTDRAPLVGIVMGSRSDWETMQHAAEKLDALGVPYEVKVVSAHRTPDRMFAYAESAGPRGLRAIIAGAGGAAALPG